MWVKMKTAEERRTGAVRVLLHTPSTPTHPVRPCVKTQSVLQAGSKHTCQERRGGDTGPGNVPATLNGVDSTGGRSQLQLFQEKSPGSLLKSRLAGERRCGSASLMAPHRLLICSTPGLQRWERLFAHVLPAGADFFVDNLQTEAFDVDERRNCFQSSFQSFCLEQSPKTPGTLGNSVHAPRNGRTADPGDEKAQHVFVLSKIGRVFVSKVHLSS